MKAAIQEANRMCCTCSGMSCDTQCSDPSPRDKWIRKDLDASDSTIPHHKTNHEGYIEMTNAAVPLPPDGLTVVSDFVSHSECVELIDHFQKSSELSWEGFDQRKRVLRYDLSTNDNLPAVLKLLNDRLRGHSFSSSTKISIEEYPKGQLLQAIPLPQQRCTTKFESTSLCSCKPTDCGCFLAIVPITASVGQALDRPQKRVATCWPLSSPDHITNLLLNKRSLYIEKRDLLWNWRSRISYGSDSDTSHYIVLKFTNIPDDAQQTPIRRDPGFGYVPQSMDTRKLPEQLMPPLDELLTVIVTTSPIQSNPSTELLERVFQTFFLGGSDFALKCRKVVICDGCRRRNDENVSKRHSSSKQAMRNGIVDEKQRQDYNLFKENLQTLCQKATNQSPFCNTTVEELESRQGYGFALRHAVQECVHTPYVIVIQHDRTFMRMTPVAETVSAMWHDESIKYVGFSMRSNVIYRDHFLGKYGSQFAEELSMCVRHPPELVVDSRMYGPESSVVDNVDLIEHDVKLRKNLCAFVEKYRGSSQHIEQQNWEKNHGSTTGKCHMSLTPVFFWYDNVHICETKHYRDFIFDPRFKMVAKGGFVEDKVSPEIKNTVERLGLTKGHQRFGCFLLDDHSGMFFTGHMDGGSYLTDATKRSLANGTGTK